MPKPSCTQWRAALSAGTFWIFIHKQKRTLKHFISIFHPQYYKSSNWTKSNQVFRCCCTQLHRKLPEKNMKSEGTHENAVCFCMQTQKGGKHKWAVRRLRLQRTKWKVGLALGHKDLHIMLVSLDRSWQWNSYYPSKMFCLNILGYHLLSSAQLP